MTDQLPPAAAEPSEAETARERRLNALDELLDDLRQREPTVPHWEFCEGFMAALVCCRRAIEPDEYLPLLLGAAPLDPPPGWEPSAASGDPRLGGIFADLTQRARFQQLWDERWSEVAIALSHAVDIDALDDERAYHPELSDMRALVARLPPEQQAVIVPSGTSLPAYAQLWALGFLEVVDAWPEEWAPPRERDTRELIEGSLELIAYVAEDDDGVPTVSPRDDADPPSVSEARYDEFGDALWAVQDLYRVWRVLGPRSAPQRKAALPGRNEPCWCGSGKKFKKCHGV